MCYLLCSLLGAVLVVALRAHGPSSAAVAEHGLLAVSNLAANHAANKTLLGEAGVCPGECVCACVQASVFTQYFLATTKFFWIRVPSCATMQYLSSVFLITPFGLFFILSLYQPSFTSWESFGYLLFDLVLSLTHSSLCYKDSF